MKTLCNCLLLFFSLFLPVTTFGAHGIAIANFGIAGQVDENGSLLKLIKYNDPQVGAHLQDYGTATIDINNKATTSFSTKDVKMSWPISNSELSDSQIGISVKAQSFAPVKINDALVSCLPVIYVVLDITNTSSASKQVTATLSHSNISSGFSQETGYACLKSSDFLIGVKGTGAAGGGGIQGAVTVGADETEQITLFVVRYDANCFYTNTYNSITSLASYAAQNSESLLGETQKVADAIPVTGITDVDRFTPWYYACGTMLTKRLKDGQSWTMGYTNLTIRDWYWTTWVHLEFWKDLYENMVDLVADHQYTSGKIMTAINPDIERGNDIDSNLFFVLAIFRYLFKYNDMGFVDQYWDAVKKAMDWVITRDNDNDGIPDQVNSQDGYWADWFDIPQVVGRKYGPFFTLLWLASLKQTALVAELRGDSQAQSKYKAQYDKAYANINKNIGSGGQWNDSKNRYESVWYPGYENAEYANRCYVDQTVGILYGVIPADRISKVQTTLYATLKCPYGLKTMDKGNDYWSGGIRPWLNFIHCTGCFFYDRDQEGLEIMDDLAQADLVIPGEYLVHEWINPDNGSNQGAYIPQGWCSDWVMAVKYGILRDTTPPTKPDNLSGAFATTSRIDLTWDESEDNESAVLYYNVYRDGNVICKTTETTYIDNSVSSDSVYYYNVSAVNASPVQGEWLESEKSDSARVPDIQEIFNDLPVQKGSIQIRRAQEEIFIYIPSEYIHTITISNMQGRAVASFNVKLHKNWFQIPVSLSQGMYIITATGDRKIFARKLYLTH